MRYCLSFVFLYISFFSVASPAPHEPVVFTQPDGSKITIMLHGDEYLNWASTIDGYTAIFDDESFYVYAFIDGQGNLVPSEFRVHNPEDRKKEEIRFISALEKGLCYSKKQFVGARNTDSYSNARTTGSSYVPTKGKNRFICILVSFPEKKFNLSKEDFRKLFNDKGYSVNNAKGSVRDYYLEASYNQFDIQTDVYGPYMLSREEGYYGAPDAEGKGGAMAIEAIQLADKDIDYTLYDNDNDNTVEGIYIIAAGKDEMNGGGEQAMWPHKSYFSSSSPVLDNMKFTYFAISGELRNDESIVTIGTICHEMGHLFGAKDYYDGNRDAGMYSGIGKWCLMSGGNHNNSGRSPAHPNAYIKSKVFEWVTPTLLNKPKNQIRLTNIEERSDQYYYFNTPTQNEYFLMENRTKTGFDSYLPGEGLIIYHVHSELSPYVGGANAGHPQMLYPVCAGAGTDPYENNPNSYGEINSGFCPFPGSKDIRAFTYYTLPSNRSWAGQEAQGHLTNIAFDPGTKTVSFDFLKKEPYNLKIRAVSSSKVRLSWEVFGRQEVLISRSMGGSQPFLTNGQEYQVGDVISSGNEIVFKGTANEFIDTELKPSTNYYYHIWSKNGNEYFGPIEAEAATDPLITKEFEKGLTEYFNPGTREYWQTIGYQGEDSEWQFKCYGTDPRYGCITQTYYNKSELISPTVICKDYDYVRLTFNHLLTNNYYIARVYYSTDNEQTWQLIDLWSENYTEKEYTYSIPTDGAPKIKFRWELSNQDKALWELYYVIIDSFNKEVTGIQDENNTNISVYPIPAEGLLNVNMTGLSGYADVKLYNLCGEVVYQKEVKDIQRSPVLTLNTEAYARGVYMLKINLSGSTFSKKVVINQ